MKPVVLSRHARDRLADRDTTEQEVIQAIRNQPWVPVDEGRFGVTEWYPFGREHKGRFYAGKDVRPIFEEEADRVVVVTLYAYFNQRAEPR